MSCEVSPHLLVAGKQCRLEHECQLYKGEGEGGRGRGREREREGGRECEYIVLVQDMELFTKHNECQQTPQSSYFRYIVC